MCFSYPGTCSPRLRYLDVVQAVLGALAATKIKKGTLAKITFVVVRGETQQLSDQS